MKRQLGRTLPRAILLLQLLSWTACKTTDYALTITGPLPGQLEVKQGVNTRAGTFPVSGTSAGIYSDPKLKIYVLVHPTDPPADWYVQPAATVDPDGKWLGPAWIGSDQFAPKVGDQLEVLAIASDTRPANQLADPRSLDVVARSNVVKYTIGSIKPPAATPTE